MENDIILEEGEGFEGYIDYHEIIGSCFNALSAVDMINTLEKTDEKRISQIKSKCLYLIHRSITELVKEFDEAHE